MRNITTIQKDQVVNVKQAEVKKKFERIASVLPGDGHTCYEFNKITFELRKAKIKEDKNYDVAKKAGTNKQVDVKENCYYITALNSKNAARKIGKRFRNIPFIKEIIE